MGLIKDFIQDAKDKKVASMTKEEKIDALRNQKLDDYTINAIAKSFGVHPDIVPDGLSLKPKILETSPNERQHFVRMMLGDFITGDTVFDNKNHMAYYYEEKEYDTGKAGFKGREHGLHRAPREEGKTNNVTVVVPETIMGIKVISLDDALWATRYYNIQIDIQAKDVIFNDALKDSGIVNIPDFDAIKPLRSDGPSGNTTEVSGLYLYEMLRWCENIKPETKLEFIINNYGKNTINGDFSKEMAEREFGIQKKPFLTQEDVNRMNYMVNGAKNATTQQKLTFCTQLLYETIPEMQTRFGYNIKNAFHRELGIKKEFIPDAYLASLNSNQLNISKVMVVGKNGILVPLYLVTTQDNIAMIYDAEKNWTIKAGTVTQEGVKLNEKYESYDFKEIVQEEYDYILNPLREKFEQFREDIANDVLTNNIASVPTTSTENINIEDR